MLNVENICFSYGEKPLLKNISFTLEEGEILHLKGKNGSGKSTFLELMAGLRRPDSGHFFFSDKKIETTGFDFLAADNNALFCDLSAHDNLKFWSQLKLGQLSETNDTVFFKQLEAWGLKGEYIIKSLAVKKFSTGMRRRLALARVFMQPFSCLLLDEPSNGLDSSATSTLLHELTMYSQNGGMVIITNHDDNFFNALPFKRYDLDIH